MGHVDYTGGGPLNLFGKAFRKANFEWTHELCRADTDGDGESNGQELGDPCCLWKTGKVPMRQWGLSHPGESHSTTGMNFSYYNSCVKKTGNDDFWSFYFANADDKSTPPFKRVGVDVHEWIQLRLRAYHKHGLNYFNPVASLLNDKGPLMRSTKELFTALLTMTVLYIVLVLAFRHAMCCCICRACGDPGDRCIRATTCLREEDNGGTNLENETIVRSKRTLAVVGRGSGSGSGSSTKETDHEMKGGCRYWCGGGLSGYDHMKLMVVAFVYTDWMSGLLHVVLDNPVMNTWPGIGPEARAFQGHHFDPTGVARGPILDMVREDHSVVFIVMIVLAVLRPSSPGLLNFGLHFSWMSHLMMASHRWSHTHPKYLSWMTIKMQQFGILMTTRHHSKHHASYDCNFCIFSGLMNPLLNRLVYVVHWRSPLWFFLLVFFIASPAIFTNKSIRQWITRLPGRCLWCSRRKRGSSSSSTSVSAANISANSSTLPSSTMIVFPSEISSLHITYNSVRVTTKRSRKFSGVVACTIGSAITLSMAWMMMFEITAPLLLCAHIACMTTACLVLSTIAVTSYSFASIVGGGGGDRRENQSGGGGGGVGGGGEGCLGRYGGEKASVRKVHRALNMLSVLFLAGGLMFIFLHVVLRHEKMIRYRSIHWWLALFVVTGIIVQATTGLLKYAALTGSRAGQMMNKFKWHGQLGWYVYLSMLLTINSGIVESTLFDQHVFYQMSMQSGLLIMALCSAHSLNRLPAFQIVLESPWKMLLREWLSVCPEFVDTFVTSPSCCKGLRRDIRGKKVSE